MANFTRTKPTFKGPLQTEGVIFLADMISVRSNNGETVNRRDLEKTTKNTRDSVMQGLADAGYEAVHIDHPSQLTQQLAWAQKHIVLSTYGGEGHRSRTIWSPAICESHEIPYVGLDGFGQGLCHSKMAAKDMARKVGLKTPRAREYHDLSQVQHTHDWAYPVIVKPSTEGSSIGIDDKSIVETPEALQLKISALLSELNAPVMVEEFVSGREVSFSAIEGDGVIHHSFNEVVIDGNPDYFETHVWDAHDKFHDVLPRRIASIDDELDPTDLALIGSYLAALGSFGYIRIDGRLADGRFHFLEATPDAWLGDGGQLSQGFVNEGWTYGEVMATIIETARVRLPNLTAID